MYLANIRRKHVAGGTITRRSVATAVVTIPRNSYTYTGDAISPLVSVRLDGALLSVNEDYTVAYVNNTDIGLATVVITGVGDFYGTTTAEFYITSAGTTWADFDLSNITTDSHVASAKLYDSGATYSPGVPIDAYSIQLLPDGRLLFGAQAQGHAYIWGFDEGHPFEVGHFKSVYDSRAYSAAYNCSFILSRDGLIGVRSYYDADNLTKASLTTKFNLATITGATSVSMATGYAAHMAFSSDGTKFFHKRTNHKTLYCRSLHTPYVVDDFLEAEVVSIDLDAVAGEGLTGNWNGFCFSPDGRTIVLTRGNGNGYVHKLVLSTPWDISTAEHVSVSSKLLSGQCVPEGVVVNADGTKMILCDGKARGSYGDRTFYEYNLTT